MRRNVLPVLSSVARRLFTSLALATGMLAAGPAAAVICDLDDNGIIDRVDLEGIFAARNTAASGVGDPADADSNGAINILDVRACSRQCTLAGCASNRTPNADAGADSAAGAGELVQLDGSRSSDPDGDALTYLWALVDAPQGGSAQLGDPTAVMPTFEADSIAGDYVFELTVNDGVADSPAASVTVRVDAGPPPPIADAGVDATLTALGAAVTLDGSGSTSSAGELRYAWTVVGQPADANVALSDPSAVMPSFTPTRRGRYEFSLVVTDARDQVSAEDTVVVDGNINRLPVADASGPQEAFIGDAVTLDGRASSDPDGDPLDWRWSFLSQPDGSDAAFDDDRSPTPAFTIAVAGTYIVQLIVNDGMVDSLPVTVRVDETPIAPIADAGPNLVAESGDDVTVDGSASADANGDLLTYRWTFVSRPADSLAVLDDPSVVDPMFRADAQGLYVLQLVVNDGVFDSAPDTATVTVEVLLQPLADAGADDTVRTGAVAVLDGSGSRDPQGDDLSYAWSVIAGPGTTDGALSGADTVSPTLTTAAAGDYIIELVVRDDTGDESEPDRVTITASSAPVASAGDDGNVPAGATVSLDGSGSRDPEGDPLSFRWRLVSAPAGSSALLVAATTATPTFTADVPGNYVAELIVDDGFGESAPDTVTISAIQGAPVARAGPDQTLRPGASASLNGSASSDPDGDPLTYAWQIVTQPPGGNATLRDASSVSPVLTTAGRGEVVVRLTVSDGFGSSSDVVSVFGNGAPASSIAPVAPVNEGTTVALDGSASSDPEGDSLRFVWRVTGPDGTAVSLTGTDPARPAFLATVPGTYSVTLNVSDATGGGAPASISVVVNRVVADLRPTAEAGPGQSVFVGGDVTLDGSASFDPEGAALTYQWTLQRPANSGAVLDDATSVTPSFSADVRGDYTATLIVSDGSNPSLPDTVVVEARAFAVGPVVVAVDVNADPVAPTERLAIDIKIANPTDAALRDVELVLPVPAGLAFSQTSQAEPNTSTNCSSFVCNTGEDALWQLGELLPGEVRVVQVSASVIGGQLLDGDTVAVEARVRSSENAAPVVRTTTVDVAENPSLRAALGADKDPVAPGDTLTYTVDVGNSDLDATAPLRYSLQLPVGVDFTRANGNGAYDPASRTVSWNLGALAGRERQQRIVETRISSSLPRGALLSVLGTLSAGSDIRAENRRTVNVDASMPLRVAINAVPDPVMSGDTVALEFRVSNLGARTVDSPRVVLRVPRGLRFSQTGSAEPNTTENCSSFVCDVGEEAVWTFDSLSPGESLTVQVNASVLSDAVDGDLVVVPVAVTSPSFTNAAFAEQTVAIAGDLGVRAALGADQDPVAPGARLTYTVDVGNSALDAASDLVYVLRLPEGVRFASASGGGSHDAATREVRWNLGALAGGSRTQVESTVVVDAGVSEASLLLARGELRGGNRSDFDGVQERTVTVDANSPLLVAVNAVRDPVPAGGVLPLELRVSNVGSTVQENLNVLLRVPRGISFSQTGSAEPNTSTNCSSFVCNPGEEALWQFPRLAPGESLTVQINASVAANLADGDLITLPVGATASGAKSPATTERTVAIDAAATLRAALGADADPVAAGSPLTLTVDLANSGLDPVNDVVYGVTLPAELSFAAATAGGQFNAQTRVVSWQLDRLTAAQRLQLVVETNVGNDVREGTLLAVRGELRSGGAVRSVQERAVAVTDESPLLVAINTLTDPVPAGGNLPLEFRVSNLGATTLSDVRLLLRVPNGISFSQTGSAEPNTSTNCSSFVCNAGEEALWIFDTLAPGQTLLVQVNAQVAATLADGALITVPVGVTAAGAVAAATTERTVAIASAQGLGAVLGASRDPVAVGDPLSFTVKVSNTAADPQGNARYVLRLPQGLTFDDATDGGSFDAATREVRWSLGTLAGGIQRQLIADVTAANGLADGAYLLARGELRDGNGDVASVQERGITVAADTPLLIGINAVSDPVLAGGTAPLEFRVSNLGNSVLQSLRVVFRVPDGLRFSQTGAAEPNTSDNCSSFVCNPGEEATWNFASLAPGESLTVQVNATVDSTLPEGALVTVPVAVSVAGATSAATAERIIAVTRAPSLRAFLAADRDPVEPGQLLSYSVDVGNGGANPASEVGYVLRLPESLEFVAASGQGSFNPATGEVNFDFGTLAAGVRRQVVVDARVADTAPAGELLGVTGELTSSDSNGGAQARIVSVVDDIGLRVAVNAIADPVLAGGTVPLEFRVSNVGATTREGVQLVFRVPQGLSFSQTGSAEPNTSANCSSFVCNAGEEAVWQFGSVAPGESLTVQVNASVASTLAAGELITVPVGVTAAGAVAPSTAERTIAVIRAPSLRSALTVDADPVEPGAILGYSVTVGNATANAVSGVRYQLRLPPGVSVERIGLGGTFDAASRTVSWSLGAVGGGSSVAPFVDVRVAATVAAGELLTARGELRSAGGTIGAVQERTVAVDDRPAFALNVAASPDPVSNDERLALDLDVTNNSASVAETVRVVFSVPRGLSFRQVDDAEPSTSVNCSSFVCNAGEEAVWVFSDVAPGATVRVSIDADVGSSVSAGDLVSIPVRVSGSGSTGATTADVTVVLE